MAITAFFSGLGAEESSVIERIQSFLSQTATLTADIDQSLISPDQTVLETKLGKLSIMRPGKFRWDYSEPYEEQLVTDGKTLWMYESDLDSVTKRTLDDSLSNTPAALLSGTTDLLSLYDVVGEYKVEGVELVELRPKSTDTDFSLVRLGMRGGLLSLIELEDNFKQTTRIVLTNLVENPDLDESLFDFVVPEGADVIDSL